MGFVYPFVLAFFILFFSFFFSTCIQCQSYIISIAPSAEGPGNMHIPVLQYIIIINKCLFFLKFLSLKNLLTGLECHLNYTGLVKGQDYSFRIWASTAAGLSVTFEIDSNQDITVLSIPISLEAQTTVHLISQIIWGVRSQFRLLHTCIFFAPNIQTLFQMRTRPPTMPITML